MKTKQTNIKKQILPHNDMFMQINTNRKQIGTNNEHKSNKYETNETIH